MNETLKMSYEAVSKKIALDVITTLIESGNIDKAKDFAQKTIDDWRKEGKEHVIVDFRKWLLENGISLED